MTVEKFVAEFIGTGLLVLLGDAVVAGVLLARSKAENSGWIVITFAWALAVFCAVIVAGPISGAHINPAVSLAVFLNAPATGPAAFGIDSLLGYWVAQMLGGIVGAVLVYLHYYPHWGETENADLKLAVFSTGPAIRSPMWNLVSEIIGTFVLLFVIFAFSNNAPTTPAGLGSLGAFPVALLVLAIGLSLGGTTGYAINPARDLGPRIAHFILPIPGKRDSDWEYAWIPVVGPLIGGALAAILYKLLFTNFMARVINLGG